MQKSQESTGLILPIIKGSLISVIFALTLILAFAGIIKLTGLSEGVIKPVNQFIKAIAIFIGCFFGVRHNRGAIKGSITGVVFTLIIYLLFMLIGGNITFNGSFFIDLIFGLIIGAISGILTVNMKR